MKRCRITPNIRDLYLIYVSSLYKVFGSKVSHLCSLSERKKCIKKRKLSLLSHSICLETPKDLFFKKHERDCIYYYSDQLTVPLWFAVRHCDLSSFAELDRTVMIAPSINYGSGPYMALGVAGKPDCLPHQELNS